MTTAFIVMGTGLGQSDTLSVGAAQDGVCCWLADGQRPFDHFCADFWPVSGVLGAHCMTNSMAPDQAVRLQPGPMPSVVGSDQVDHVLMCVAGASDMLRAFLDNVAPLWIPEARISVLFSPRCSAWHRPCQSTCTAAGWLLTQNHICRASLSVCLTNLRWESYRPCAPLQDCNMGAPTPTGRDTWIPVSPDFAYHIPSYHQANWLDLHREPMEQLALLPAWAVSTRRQAWRQQNADLYRVSGLAGLGWLLHCLAGVLLF
ncbi:unnamed protein product [Symbiodinium natans]|uniref:Uncharacterized protein n=1 Tax=Symbiodinium natans TaxID=878477 RepID=A0A812K0J5_9DINO|nr:unnamed protein product [Symbiodinium natans]